MPSADSTLLNLLPSLMDRLTQPGALGASGHGNTLTLIIESVRRDVEALLNTRRNEDSELARYPELARSVFGLGMPELISRPALTSTDRQAIGRAIAETITRYEPRLRDVRTILISPADSLERRLKFRIEGTLRVEPSPGVEFETILELSSGQTSVTTGPS
ncbi:MAG: type VI secretion system baseplate subunit TssE [Bacteroidales bacterium]|nr:type VI secretion system baseplate subunit TssE [Bacteroidales bacterium]